MRAADDHLRWVGEAAVVSMPAEIDVTNAGEVSARLSTAASHGPARLIIDMSETTFCDSVGVQAIIEAYNLVDAGNQRAANRTELRIVATAVRRIMELVGIDQLIPVYATLDLALADPAGQRTPSQD